MLAILGALLEENDNDNDFRPFKIDFSIPGEYTDMEVSRVGVCATVSSEGRPDECACRLCIRRS